MSAKNATRKPLSPLYYRKMGSAQLPKITGRLCILAMRHMYVITDVNVEGTLLGTCSVRQFNIFSKDIEGILRLIYTFKCIMVVFMFIVG